MNNIVLQTTKVFYENYKAYKLKKWRVLANQGSTRSSKTYSILQLLIYICLTEKRFVSVVSCTIPHLKKGARKDFLEILETMTLFKENSFNRTDNIYTFDNGSQLEFFSADNSAKLRGSKRDILYINEANLITFDSYKQLALRTTGEIFIDFNPADDENYVYNISILPDTFFLKSTYLDNIKNLSTSQINEIENLNPQKNPITGDLNAWKVYGLGERGSSGLAIYTHQRLYNEIPKDIKIKDVIYGLDFGFNDPTVLIEISITSIGYFCKEVIYEGMSEHQIVQRFKDLGINKNKYIYADTNASGSIFELQKTGFNVIKAKKDVLVGIGKVKSVPIYLQENSQNLIKEMKNYKWKERDNKPIDEPSHPFSHCPDAIRYAIYTNDYFGDMKVTTNHHKPNAPHQNNF